MNLKSSVAVRARSSRRLSLAVLLVSSLVAGLMTAAGTAAPAIAQTAPATGVYVPLSPARIFNTQAGGGGVVAAQTSRDVQVTGLGGIPTTDVLAVVLDLTVYNNNSGAWGILWQAGTTRPYPASSINYVPGRVVTNSVTTKVGAAGSAAGKVSFFTWEATHMLIDVVGYYRTAPGGGGYVPLTQTRILDTAGAKIPANSSIDRKLRGVAGIPDSTAVTAVVFNATVYGASGPGPLTVWPKGVARPDTSVMNYSPATARTEMVTATLSPDGWASVWTWASIDLIIDIAGYYTTGSNSTFVPLTPKRIVDTRYNGTRYNNNPNWGIGPVTQYLAPNTTTAIKVTGTGGVPETGVSPVSTVILNVVADAATTATSSQIGFLTVWASGDPQPGILTMSYYGAESASNLVMAKVGADGKINIYNYYASTELIIDVVGYFTTGTGPGAPTNVIAASANQAATLAWGPPASDGGTAIAGYLVKVYKTTPTLTYVSETTTCATCTSTTLTGLTNGQPYQFEVFARNSLGYGSSATSNVVTPNMTTTTSSSTTSTSTTSSSTTTSTSTSTTSTTTTVPPTTTTSSSTTTTTMPGVPNAPLITGLSAPFVRDGRGVVTLTWEAPTQLNGAQILNYTIESDQDCCRRSPAVDARSAEIAGLEIGVENRFRIRTSTTNGAGEWSAWSRPVVTQLPSLRLVTWNIKRNLAEAPIGSLPDTWQSRGPIEDIADAIAHEQPDVVALQEVTNDQATAIAERLGWSNPYYEPSESPCPVTEFYPPGCVPFGNALLSRFTFTSTQRWVLPAFAPDKPDQRILLRAAILVEGVRFHIYTAHLTSDGGAGGRREQAAAVVGHVGNDRAASSGIPFQAVVMGDFNADANEPTINEVMVPTVNPPFENVTDGNPTSNARDVLNRRIDYIFVDSQGPWKINETRVMQTGDLSDHLAVFARL